MKNPTFWNRLRFAYQAFKNYHRIQNGLPVAIELISNHPSDTMAALQDVLVTYVVETGQERKKTLSFI